jgi:hypothetical protein
MIFQKKKFSYCSSQIWLEYADLAENLKKNAFRWLQQLPTATPSLLVRLDVLRA